MQECWDLMTKHGPYAGSREELTPLRADWPSALPAMVTTERATPSVEGAPPPTMACAGEASSKAATIMENENFIRQK